MSAFDDINNAFHKGNQNRPESKSVRTVKKAKNKQKQAPVTIKKSTGHPTSYKTIRASAAVANLYKALQIATGSKSRSQIMLIMAQAGMDKVLDTTAKRTKFKRTMKVIKAMNDLKE